MTTDAPARPFTVDPASVRRFRRYPEYKDSGVEWLGEVPVGWGVVKLKNIASIENEKLNEKPDELTYIGLENIQSKSGKLIFKGETDVDGNVILFKSGDILFGKLRPYLAKVALVDINGCCSTEIIVLTPNGNEKFLFYRLLSNEFIHLINSSTYGVKMPRASPNFIINSSFAIPPLPEQRQIADFLDRETQKIDSLIAKKKRFIELLEEKRTSLISHAVTKGLDPDCEMKDSGVEWLGAVPVGWGVGNLWFYCDVLTGGTPNRNITSFWEKGTINWLNSGEVNKKTIYNVDNKITELGLANSNAKLLPTNSILMALNGQGKTKGTVAVLKVSSTCNQSLAAIICGPEIHYKYKYFYLNSCYRIIRNLVGDNLREGLNLDLIRHFKILIPPLPEQHNIADFLDRETQKIDNIIEKTEEQITKLEEYRTALISAAVTGKIDVREEASA